jgi:hypothetical protein
MICLLKRSVRDPLAKMAARFPLKGGLDYRWAGHEASLRSVRYEERRQVLDLSLLATMSVARIDNVEGRTPSPKISSIIVEQSKEDGFQLSARASPIRV